MLTRTRLDELPALGQPLHLALGVFDGVHIGHQAVIARAVEAARRDGGLAGVVTFDPHPIRVIAPAKAPSSLLATLDHKARIVEALGVELFIPLHFDASMAAKSAAEFIAELARADLRTIAVGEDWRFGHHRSGDVEFLDREAEIRKFRLAAVPPVMLDGDRVSSTRVRQAIRDGNLADAARMLGTPYCVSGEVVEGRKLGRTLDFPTANVATGDCQLPPDGVWAVKVFRQDGIPRNGVANLGMRPTVAGTARVLEAHIFGFSETIYGEGIDVEFQSFLRPELKFPTLDALRAQIQSDAAQAERFFEAPA